MSYAEIAKQNIQPGQLDESTHMNGEIKSFIDNYFKEDLAKSNFDQIKSNIIQISKINKYLKNLKLSKYSKNADHFTLTLHFNKKNDSEIESLINQFKSYGLLLQNIIINNKNDKTTKIHIMVKSKEILDKVLDNRNSLKYFTSSRDYHIITASIPINISIEAVLNTIQHSQNNNLKMAYYHCNSTKSHNHIFGLIEFNRECNIDNFKYNDAGIKVTIKQATNAYIKKIKQRLEAEKAEKFCTIDEMDEDTDNSKIKKKRKLTTSTPTKSEYIIANQLPNNTLTNKNKDSNSIDESNSLDENINIEPNQNNKQLESSDTNPTDNTNIITKKGRGRGRKATKTTSTQEINNNNPINLNNQENTINNITTTNTTNNINKMTSIFKTPVKSIQHFNNQLLYPSTPIQDAISNSKEITEGKKGRVNLSKILLK